MRFVGLSITDADVNHFDPYGVFIRQGLHVICIVCAWVVYPEKRQISLVNKEKAG